MLIEGNCSLNKTASKLIYFSSFSIFLSIETLSEIPHETTSISPFKTFGNGDSY